MSIMFPSIAVLVLVQRHQCNRTNSSLVPVLLNILIIIWLVLIAIVLIVAFRACYVSLLLYTWYLVLRSIYGRDSLEVVYVCRSY